MRLTLTGAKDVEKQLARMESKCKEMGRYRAMVGSSKPYAWGVEFGRHRLSGKLARGAGGSLYLRRAMDQVMGNSDTDIAQGLSKVQYPGVWILRRLGLWVRRLGRSYVPRQTGQLRRSIVFIVEAKR